MWFAYVLTILFVVTGVFWVLDKFIFAPQRHRNANAIKAKMSGGYDNAVAAALARPAWLEYTAGLFGVIALVFVLRSFLYEPFRIPSGSMLPTLYVGDFILVNKYAYGIRLPIGNKVVVPIGTPQRGDIMVFQYPLDKSQNYIKRVIGIPNDVVRYENKILTVNGKTYTQQTESGEIPEQEQPADVKLLEQGERAHDILTRESYPSVDDRQFRALGIAKNSQCQYFPNGTGFECKVPAGEYFMMGDNRDNSTDGRYWGFVPDNNIVGRASAIWMHWHDFPSLLGITLARDGSLEGK